jgi:hypothetical protein
MGGAEDMVKESFDIIKDVVEVLAYISALIFFVFRVSSGYFVVDMAISVDCERKRKPGAESKDYLGISVALKKGERASVQLHDAQVRISSCISDQVLGPFSLTTVWRTNRTDLEPDIEASRNLCPELKPKQNKRPTTHRAQIDWTCIPQDTPRINLPPGDESKLAACVEVDQDIPYMIEVVVLARTIWAKRRNGRFGQWRGSKVSLPIESEKTGSLPLTGAGH